MPTSSSAVVVINADKQVLLVLRKDSSMWALPAGLREPGETNEQTAIREVFEETGYRVALLRTVGEYWRPQYPNGGDTVQVFAGKIINGIPSPDETEVSKVQWFPLNSLPKRLFRFSAQHIKDACRFSKEPIKKEQKLSMLESKLLSGFFFLRNCRSLIFQKRHK